MKAYLSPAGHMLTVSKAFPAHGHMFFGFSQTIKCKSKEHKASDFVAKIPTIFIIRAFIS